MISTLQWRVAIDVSPCTKRAGLCKGSAARLPSPRRRRLPSASDLMPGAERAVQALKRWRGGAPQTSVVDAAGLPATRRAGCARPVLLLSADLARIGDFEDLEIARAARRVDLDRVAGLASDQGLAERRADRQQALLHLGLLRPDDLVHDFLVGLLVDQLDPGAELDGAATLLADVDDRGAGQLVLDLEHAALDEALALAR